MGMVAEACHISVRPHRPPFTAPYNLHSAHRFNMSLLLQDAEGAEQVVEANLPHLSRLISALDASLSFQQGLGLGQMAEVLLHTGALPCPSLTLLQPSLLSPWGQPSLLLPALSGMACIVCCRSMQRGASIRRGGVVAEEFHH